jgi:hypothetical protein
VAHIVSATAVAADIDTLAAADIDTLAAADIDTLAAAAADIDTLAAAVAAFVDLNIHFVLYQEFLMPCLY